jgi:amidohydrolase
VPISPEVRAVSRELVAIRRDVHSHPELGFQEKRTSRLIESTLKRFGVRTRRVCGTGVIGLIEGSRPGPTILIRADIDALPLTEENLVPYRSRIPGVMHACGHDTHVAMGLAAASVLSRMRERLRGNVKFMFQPAEEGPGGAVPMIRAGLLRNPKVDLAFALHAWNELPVGRIGVRPGPVFAGAGSFAVTIHGRGGHGASPHETIDPIVVAANFITQAQSVVSRRISPVHPAVVTFGKIEGGTRHNIIPDRVALSGTYRWFDDATLRRLKTELRRTLDGVAAASGARATLEYTMDEYPPTVNDPEAALLAREAAAIVVGGRNVVEQEITMGAEDMAFVLRRVPGCYVALGSSNRAKGLAEPHHSPRFDVDESCLPIGVEFWVRLAERALS